MEQLQKTLSEVWEEWTIEEKLGEGTFGKVYKIKREFLGREQFAALKAIRISQNKTSNGFSFSVDDKSFVDEIVSEIELMAKIKGNTNIVSYEDHRVIEDSNGMGFTILIRMELLTPLSAYIENNEITEETVIKLGTGITKALEILGKNHILHRDIKLENIFVSENGDFKLGDFGTARIVEKTIDNRTKTGTYMYMAPEVIRNEPYGAKADIYSLGILMYYLLNHFRFPFFPAYPNPVCFEDSKIAFAKRTSGEAVPPLACKNPKLSAIVLKACEFDSKNRFESAHEMNLALENLNPEKAKEIEEIIPEPIPKKNNKKLIIAAVVAAVVAIVGVCGFAAKKISDSRTADPSNTVSVQSTTVESSTENEQVLTETEQEIEDLVIDILMNGYTFNSIYLDRLVESGEKLYYTFIDVDFDGINELLVNHDYVSDEYKSADIYKFDFEEKDLFYSKGYLNDSDLDGIMLFGARSTNKTYNPFFLVEEKTYFEGDLWYKLNRMEYVKNKMVITELSHMDISAGTIEYNDDSYDSVLKEHKENQCKILLEKYDNLNIQYKIIDGEEYNNMSAKEKEAALREAYRAFNYEGKTAPDEIPTAAPMTTQAQSTEKYIYHYRVKSQVDKLNIYTSPDENSEVVIQVPGDTLVESTGELESDWIYIEYDGKNGWVKYDQLNWSYVYG